MREKILLFLSILLIVPISYGACNFEDDFEYDDDINNHGWEGSSFSPISIDGNRFLKHTGSGSISRIGSLNQTTGDLDFRFRLALDNFPATSTLKMSFRGDEDNDVFALWWDNRSSICSAVCGSSVSPCLYSEDIPFGTPNTPLDCITNNFDDGFNEYILEMDLDSGLWRLFKDFADSEFLAQSTNFNITKGINELFFNVVSSASYSLDDVGCVDLNLECKEPLLFCDNFDYDNPLSKHDWIVFTEGDIVDSFYTPLNNQLNLIGDGELIKPFHNTGVFSVIYGITVNEIVYSSIYSPLFTSEFDLTIKDYGIYSLDSCTQYNVFGELNKEVYDFHFCPNGSIMSGEPKGSIELCIDCFNANDTHSVRIATFFRNNSEFPFSSNNDINRVWLFVDVTTISDNISFINNDATTLKEYYIQKDINSRSIIDNYFVMIGNDKVIDTSTSFYEHFSDPELREQNVQTILENEIGSPCEDNSECFIGTCEYGYCALQNGKTDCDADADCISGVCLDNICTKPSVWQGISASKTQQFGDDTDSNNFISLFFIIGLPLAIILTAGKSGVLAGILIYFGGAFFFTIVGWLSPFILLGSIIAGLIMMMFVFMLGGSSSS